MTLTTNADAARRDAPGQVLQALRLPRKGTVYDLDPGRFAGMPLYQGHPPWQLISYRTPQGIRNQGDQKWLAEDNEVNVSIMTEILIAGMHSGAHIDALAHITCGPDAHWHGGYSANEHLSDFGPMNNDASTIQPIIARGVLIDLAAALGYDRLPASYAVSVEEFEAALRRQGTAVRDGDVVLFRTGQMSVWPDRDRWAETSGAGITLPVAERLIESGVRAVGGDTETVEVMPSIVPGNPHPIHIRLLIEEGIHLIECLYLEDLARDGVYEFLFITLPAKITGATASLVRPVAVI
jgi:kynurenine formamidase